MITKLLRFIEYCRKEGNVAVLFVQPDGAYTMFPVPADFMADKEADEAIGHALVALYRDGLAGLESVARSEKERPS